MSINTIKLILQLLMPVILVACGQKGALYLDATGVSSHNDSTFIVAGKASDIVAKQVEISTLNIVGERAQVQHNNTPSWQKLLHSEESVNLIRYVSFSNDVLGSSPYNVLLGRVQKPNSDKHRQKTIPSGLYLHFHSPESGIHHIPSLLSTASRYLQQHRQLRRRPQDDFLTEKQQSIDLYIAIERAPQ